MPSITINRQKRELDVPADMPLLWALRDELSLTGTKYGCGKALCGACTVLLDGLPVRSCIVPVSAVGDQAVTTIEGLESTVARAVQTAWGEIDVAQCGYCQSGQVVAATALLTRTPAPSDAEITAAMDGNLCRCATYVRIRRAIHRAAELLA